MSFKIKTGAIVVVIFFVRCIFSPDSAIASMFLLGEFGGFPIQFIKLTIYGILVTIATVRVVV